MNDMIATPVLSRSNAILGRVAERVSAALERCGFPGSADAARFSDRTDISDFQSNVAFRLAKQAKMPPIKVAERIVAELAGDLMIRDARVDGAGFVNFRLSDDFLAAYLAEIAADPHFGTAQAHEARTFVIDYGGPNVAKSMHVGHLRSTIIGDCLLRLTRFLGFRAIGDVHLGDWGTQMGMLIHELSLRAPDLPYFDAAYDGPYPADPPLSLPELEEMYPAASARCKESPADMDAARLATAELQAGRAGYVALWQHFVALTTVSLKRDFAFLGVSFDLWWGESTVHDRIPGMIRELRAAGLAVESDGALVIPVATEQDKTALPPLILEKSDGAVMYGTTDLATLRARFGELDADWVLYVVDQRQGVHFQQVFRAAAKAGYCRADQVEHIGFGTVNGPDGKPFKTRTGGVMKLNTLLESAHEKARERLYGTKAYFELDDAGKELLARSIAIAALKFADLSNHRLAAYAFDLDRFVSFEGKTGPYIQYTVARINSMLAKATERDFQVGPLRPAARPEERELQILLSQFADTAEGAFTGRIPNLLCDGAFKLAQAFSRFYASCHVLTEEDPAQRASWLAVSDLTRTQLMAYLDILGIPAVEKM
ncbi:MAG TPA: arginine--tRNA ligase [Rhodopila sp.]|uniref:arginine--tRNA ligase n=1 Tax=Rhodopila sp. TaxID=2480087 RepID=UPI002C8029B6|nr:arginine--tRNA ligase [Rhodopila sp.]HVY13689.1 arginine--tRNA ligase [Rhodopila sp.]